MTILDDFGLIRTRACLVDIEEVYGRLEVVATGQVPNTYRYMAVCRCSCDGKLVCVRSDHLKSGRTTSCGCFHKEQVTTHGQTDSGHYFRWRNMMDRCYNERCQAWKDYGGRGIRVAERWHDPAVFVAELPPGYQDGLAIDRINNNGNYEPGNIKWSTQLQNNQNRSNARLLTLGDRTQSLTEWANELGIHKTVLFTRLEEGWSVERALTEPVADKVENMRRAQALRWAGHEKKPRPEPRVLKRFPYQGENLTVSELSERTGIDDKLLRKRLCERGWSVEKATEQD